MLVILWHNTPLLYHNNLNIPCVLFSDRRNMTESCCIVFYIKIHKCMLKYVLNIYCNKSFGIERVKLSVPVMYWGGDIGGDRSAGKSLLLCVYIWVTVMAWGAVPDSRLLQGALCNFAMREHYVTPSSGRSPIWSVGWGTTGGDAAVYCASIMNYVIMLLKPTLS